VTARATPVWVWHAGGLLVVLALSGLAWWLSDQITTGLVYLGYGLGLTQMAPEMGKVLRPFWARWRQRRFRVSIGALMVLVVLAAVYLGLMRALDLAYPIDDVGTRWVMWGFFLFLYAMLCIPCYVVWFGVHRIRAIVAEDQNRHSGRRPEE
jgi:hypothetical protein